MTPLTGHPRAPKRHEVDVERRRAHPGEPRRSIVTDRPPAREDRRGAHGIAGGRGR
jgi:hypothetical protein